MEELSGREVKRKALNTATSLGHVQNKKTVDGKAREKEKEPGTSKENMTARNEKTKKKHT